MLALGTALAGCSSLGLGGSTSSGATVTVRAESNPAGAEARAQVGAPCRTPCALEIPASGTSSVTFSLQGYLPQTIPVTVTAGREADLSETGVVDQTRIDPNPVFAVLEPAPPPPPPVRRKPAPRKPRPAPAAQPAPPPPPPQQQGFGPPQQPPPPPGGFGPPPQQQPVFR